MSSNLDYLNPDLRPLEDKVNAYLAAEKELHRAELEATTLPFDEAQAQAATQVFEQRSAAGSYAQHSDEIQQRLANLRDDLASLRRDIISLLPTRDEWVKVNLGYGPSRVGAFRRDAASNGPDAEYELRVVH